MQELLPPKRKPHPTAKAFFDALDLHQHQQKEEDDDDSDDDDGNDRKKKTTSAPTTTRTTKTKTPTMSRSLQRKCQSLGWRNRYSQNEYYPISLNLNLNLNLNMKKKEKILTRHQHHHQQQQQQQQHNRVVLIEDEGEDEKEADGNEIEINEDNATQRQQQQHQQEVEHQWNSIHNKNNSKTTVVNFSVKQVQRGEVDGTYGTGATVWPAALVLIKYLEYTTANANANANANAINTSSSSQNNHVNVKVTANVVNKHIIDLGAGTGVTSIAAAILGAKSIICTDGIDSVVQLAKDNIQRVVAVAVVTTAATTTTANDAEKKPIVTTTPIPVINNCPIRTQKYWWGEEGTAKTIIMSLCNDAGNDSENDDNTNNNANANANANIESNNNNNSNGLIILVADCVLPKLYPIEPLVEAIDECLMLYDDETNTDNNSNDNNNSSNACANSCAILSYEYRYYTKDYDPKNEFIKLATAKGLELYTVPKGDQDPIYSTDDIEIWIVTRTRQDKNEKNKSKRQSNESNAE
jgi:hypothetical protein